eukprot:CAMPEP_0119523478 /NCGR_PEP_ID=MMETSP1344-20130328/38530_1 /TAXON_ID=236787 /ORGANISM="Florenciella parvula, Strain CCMP2471" /LENGTH=98 /DNA_ID=CAMNT_0007561703 /DNA_START=313 /DNA_END=605 /DNA_ORIENTATION=+
MGRRPAGTGPRRPAAASLGGLVAYGSDEDGSDAEGKTTTAAAASTDTAAATDAASVPAAAATAATAAAELEEPNGGDMEPPRAEPELLPPGWQECVDT